VHYEFERQLVKLQFIVPQFSSFQTENSPIWIAFLSGFLDPLICHALIAEKEHPKQFPAMDALAFLWPKPRVVPLT